MKKLLCIVCLLATVLFVDAANASIGSPMRNGNGISVSTVRISSTCANCGRVAVRSVRPMVHHGFRAHRLGFHHGFRAHRFGLRHGFRAHRLGYRHGFRAHRLGYRHGLRRYGHRRVAFAR